MAVAERGQVSDRFGRAVEQLGADTLDVRLGGIYALERLMRDSPQDQPTVLSAYVRTHAPRSGRSAKRRAEDSPGRPDTDVQAALTVLGRRDSDHDYPRPTRHTSVVRVPRIDLTDTDLAHADLVLADLVGADLTCVRTDGDTRLPAGFTLPRPPKGGC